MNKLLRWIHIAGIALLLLGVIHVAASPYVMHSFENLNQDQKQSFLFMYVVAGLGVLLCGLVVTLLAADLKNKSKRSWRVIFICSIWATIMGIGAIATMMYNPFAYISLLAGIMLLVPVLIIRSEINR